MDEPAPVGFPDPGPSEAGRRPRAALLFRPELAPWLFPGAMWERLTQRVQVVAPILAGEDWRRHAAALGEVEIVVGSWGIPRFDAEVLATMKRLRVVLYGAGTVRDLVSPDFWRRGILLASASVANAGPTAIFTEALIVLALKHTWFYLRNRSVPWPTLGDTLSSGVHGATIGVIGLSRVGRALIQRLQRHEVRILAFDPTISAEEARRLGVHLRELKRLFAECDVVSLHAPLLPQTTGMIRGEHLRLMKAHATFINTARGAIVRQGELIEVMRERRDLTALLDVTDPEPTPADSVLRSLANVVITPHLAGARHRELELFGHVVLGELENYLAARPLQHAVTEASLEKRA